MKHWFEYLKEAGRDEFLEENPRPEREYLGKGEYCKEKDIIFNTWLKKYNEIESKAYDSYQADMRGENKDLSDDVYCLAYSEAYERGHSSGYDEVSYQMKDICDLIRKVIKLSKK